MLKYTEKLKPSLPAVQQLMFSSYQGKFIRSSRRDVEKLIKTELHGDDTDQRTDHEKKIDEAKKTLQWRTPVTQQKNFVKSKLSAFTIEKSGGASAEIMEFIQSKIDFSWKGFKEMRERKRVEVEKFMQQFIPERHEKLGSDLAAAHFICFRGGSVKFIGSDKWFTGDRNTMYFDFPNLYDESYELEEIRCDDMELYYEGLENLSRLKCLTRLSFRNVKTFDDWCLDRVSGSDFPSLEVLDLTGTSITERGLSALYRMPSLKMLIVDDPKKSNAFELYSLLLEETIPTLKVVPKSIPLDLNHPKKLDP